LTVIALPPDLVTYFYRNRLRIMDLSGKYALVTGASSGIGWHISHELAMRGYHIVAVSNQPSRLEELKNRLEESQAVKVIPINQELASEDAAQTLFNSCDSLEIQVEILVNNAGMLVYGDMAGTPTERVRSIVQLHVTTPALLCRLFGERMKARGSGHILNVSSISAVMPYPTISLYGPTKAFLRHFTRAIRTELKPFGLRVTCLIPGATDTPLNDQQPFNVDLGKRLGVVKSPEKVARAGIRALFRNRPVCIPGLLNKAIVYGLPLVPQSLIAMAYKWMLHSSPGKTSHN
jgi:short-subunit dehydrogenase